MIQLQGDDSCRGVFRPSWALFSQVVDARGGLAGGTPLMMNNSLLVVERW